MSNTPEDTARETVDVRANQPPRRGFVARLLRVRGAQVGIAWIAVVVLAAIVSIWFTPHDPLRQDLANSFSMPSLDHLLGTDQLGRDILSRLIHGAGETLIGAAISAGVAFVIGVPMGVVAGFYRSWFDAIASRIVDLLLTIPAIIVLLAVLAIFGNSMTLAMTALGILLSAQFFRLARASTLSLRSELFVDAAKAFGVADLRIIFRHILPNIGAPLIVQASIIISVTLLLQASLGFLGLGTKPPYPSWGQMVAEASQQIYSHPWLMVPAGLTIMLTIYAFNLIGDATRDSLVESSAVSVLASGKVNIVEAAAVADAEEPDEPASPDTAISLRNLNVTFPAGEGSVDVVTEVSFDVKRGRALALVGESGSGKTMTALSILGLVPGPGAVSGGAILFEGRNLVKEGEQTYRDIRGKKIAYISQEPMVALDPSFKVKTHLREVLRGNLKLSREAADKRAIELLRLVDLPDPEQVYNRYPHQLSGGMAQRVAIAWALSSNPDVLIADEPTTALDVTVQAGILDLLRKLMRELDMTILLLTHDLGVVADLCDDVVVMQHGSVVERGDVFRLFEAPQHEYTRTLLHHANALYTGKDDIDSQKIREV